MLTKAKEDIQIDWKFNWIFWAQVFLFLGVMSSPTIVSLFHIIIIIPTIVLVKKYRLPMLTKSSIALILLFIWGLITTFINSENLQNPFKSYGELKYYLLGVLLISPLYYFWSLKTDKKVRTLLNIFWFVIIVGFFVGLSRAWFQFDPVKMQYTTKYHPSRSGGFLNYMRYGYASAFIGILGISALINFEKVKVFINKKAFIASLVLCFCAILTAQTRGALLAVIVGAPFILLRYKPVLGKIIISIFSIFAMLVLYFSFIKPSDNRFLNINGVSNEMRMSQFASAIHSIKEKPLFGLGADQLSYHVKRLKHIYGLKHKDYASHSHNIFLEHAANYGIIGAVFLLLFLIFWFLEMMELKSAFGWAIGSYIVAFTVSGQVELLFDNTNSHILFYLYSFSQVIRLSNKQETTC